jgi:type III pantothenate kinase
MLLAIDVGNTNVVLGLFDGKTLTQTWRLGTHGEYTSDECSAIVRSLFGMSQIPPSSVKAAILSCVVPPLLPIFERTCTKSFACQPLIVGPGMRTGMAIRVDNPPEVGADRIVNAVAAHHLVGGPVISIDFGTAITFDCVSEAGEFVGGAILPGLLVSLDALVERASRLSPVEIVRPPHIIGRNTIHMIQSGMLYGHAGMIDHMVELIRSELGAEAPVIATGGLAHLIAGESKTIERVEPYLTLEGLRLIYERNRKEEP